MRPLGFSTDWSFQPHYGPGVDSASNRNEYQLSSCWQRAAGAWGWQPHRHLWAEYLVNVGDSTSHNLRAPTACYRDNFTFFIMIYQQCASRFGCWQYQLNRTTIASLCCQLLSFSLKNAYLEELIQRFILYPSQYWMSWFDCEYAKRNLFKYM
jgi:hypothetical protein